MHVECNELSHAVRPPPPFFMCPRLHISFPMYRLYPVPIPHALALFLCSMLNRTTNKLSCQRLHFSHSQSQVYGWRAKRGCVWPMYLNSLRLFIKKMQITFIPPESGISPCCCFAIMQYSRWPLMRASWLMIPLSLWIWTVKKDTTRNINIISTLHAYDNCSLNLFLLTAIIC